MSTGQTRAQIGKGMPCSWVVRRGGEHRVDVQKSGVDETRGKTCAGRGEPGNIPTSSVRSMQERGLERFELKKGYDYRK